MMTRFASALLGGVAFLGASSGQLPVAPRVAAPLAPIQLNDLIFASLVPATATNVAWDHPADAPILWLTDGIASTEEGGYRIGLARVRVGDQVSTVIKRRREELAWTISLRTRHNPKHGPETIGIEPGVENDQCFGTLYDGCDFEPAVFMASPNYAATLVCTEPNGSDTVETYRLAAPGRHVATLRHARSCGSGGCSSAIVVAPLDDPKPC